MKQKQAFVRPVVLQELSLLPGTPILLGSVVQTTTIATTGQEVKTIDGSTFEHSWE